MQRSNNQQKEGGSKSYPHSAKTIGFNSTSKGIFEVLEETADAIGKNKEKLPKFTGENPAEWIITRRLCIEWISVSDAWRVSLQKSSSERFQ
jgi:hypothetical protein